VTFPGAPRLKIEVMDYDTQFGDDLIGETIIDMDDRYFSQEWQKMIEKPIEFRQIYHPCTELPQGRISMWLDLNRQLSKKAVDNTKVWSLETEPKRDYQVRCSVYDLGGLQCIESEGTSDIYVQGYIDEDRY
jgi:hypothetical protein